MSLEWQSQLIGIAEVLSAYVALRLYERHCFLAWQMMFVCMTLNYVDGKYYWDHHGVWRLFP